MGDIKPLEGELHIYFLYDRLTTVLFVSTVVIVSFTDIHQIKKNLCFEIRCKMKI